MPLYAPPACAPMGSPIGNKSGAYYALGTATPSTIAALGVGTLRAAPVYVPIRTTLDRIGAEITLIGDVGSKLRLGIYADNGSLYPGALLLDAGTIAGDSATVQEITISQVLPPGVYWLAGVVQVVTVVQPTVRTALEMPYCPIGVANTTISADILGLINANSVPGALPALFAAGSGPSGPVLRIFVRAA